MGRGGKDEKEGIEKGRGRKERSLPYQ